MSTVMVRVAHVVDEVRGTGGGAVRGEDGERIEPAPWVTELRSEDDPGEEEQVLRPLPGSQRDECRLRLSTPARELDDLVAFGKRQWAVMLRLLRGQHELEAAAPAERRLELDASAERERELPRDREAEPGARVILREERPEDPLALMRGDSGSGVVDRDRHGAILGRELELDTASIGRPAKRVRQQVGDDLEHAVAVRDDRRRGVEPSPVVDSTPARLLTERGVRVVAELFHVDLLAEQREAVRLELREIEDVAYEPIEPRGLACDHVQRRGAHGWILRDALAQRVDVSANRRQRRAQLVRHGHQE